MRLTFTALINALAGLTMGTMTMPSSAAELSPTQWRADYERFLSEQDVTRTEAGHATGNNGAVTVAYNGLARAGLEALKQGGNAIDAALTAANMQVALTAGAPVSYFGILSLVYYDAKSDKVYTMNAEWNTVRGANAELNPNVGLPDYTTLDLRTRLEHGPWRLALRVENVTNEAGLATFSTGKLFAEQLAPSSAVLIRPRTYGLTLSVDF